VAEKKNDCRFKILYAIGMVFIVAGHGCSGIDFSWGGWFPLYSFHLALFMFCSGYFFKVDSHEHLWQFIWKKIKRLLIPLFLWNLFFAGFALLISNFGFKLGVPITIEKLTTELITSGHQFAFNLGGWFVIPLFMCYVFSILLRKCLARWNCRLKEWLIAVLYFCIGVFGIWLSHRGWGTGHASWPLVVTRFMTLLPFFGLGTLYKTKLERLDTLKNWLYFAIVIGLQLGLITYARIKAIPMSGTPSWSTYYDTIITLGTSITGIAFYLRIARILEPSIGKSKIVNKIADNTFIIMIHHLLGFWLVNLTFGLVLTMLHRGHFDWGKFQTSIWYKYYPRGIAAFSVIYLVAGLGFPILLQAGIDKIKDIIRKRSALVVVEASSKPVNRERSAKP